MPNDAELTLGQKAARRRKARIVVGLFVLLSGVPPLINAMGNPRVATLHRSDVMELLASGLCLGFGLALLIGRLIFRGE
ncbi:MAG: hypothetical protein ACR2I2_02260 [Bryobacteraceae bacterium]